jgi:outer membrane protein, heavy metal efflux system
MYFKFLILLAICINVNADEISFNDYLEEIDKHSNIIEIKLQSELLKDQGEMKASWGDPKFQITAVNFPKDPMSRNKTPMTGIKYSLSQKIPLTNKFSNIKDAFELASEAKSLDVDNQKTLFIKALWLILIEKRKVIADLKILNENKIWIENILTVSKKMYTNGRIGQQAMLDIQIRKSNLESMIFNKETALKIVSSKLSYLNNNYSSIDLSTVPWSLIDEEKIGSDFVEYSHKKNLASKEKNLTAQKKNYIPDLTIGLSYTKRNKLDGLGDFVGASISFPLPLSSTKYANHGIAVRERAIADNSYRSYKSKKRAKLQEFSLSIKKISYELDLLINKTKGYAKNSRDITSKSYRLGKSTYFELLNSELQLQTILLKENKLISLLAQIKIERNYLQGSALYETNK